MGEPLGGDKVLAAAVGGVHVAPLGPGAVHLLAVALDDVSAVSEGETRALAPTVGVGGGGLVQGLAVGGREGHGGQDGEEDEHCYKWEVGRGVWWGYRGPLYTRRESGFYTLLGR